MALETFVSLMLKNPFFPKAPRLLGNAVSKGDPYRQQDGYVKLQLQREGHQRLHVRAGYE